VGARHSALVEVGLSDTRRGVRSQSGFTQEENSRVARVRGLEYRVIIGFFPKPRFRRIELESLPERHVAQVELLFAGSEHDAVAGVRQAVADQEAAAFE